MDELKIKIEDSDIIRALAAEIAKHLPPTEVHYHVPPGSSLAQEGSIVVVRPGDIADWVKVPNG